ncbi:MAG: hypothetical protein M3O29_08390 [Actinomycetota bacterium]|nr:hypothetical protein [Actinomycetota bacterium]
MTKRTATAAIIGVVGGIATIVGPALPWLTYSESAQSGDPSFAPPGIESVSISGFSVDPFGLPFLGIALTVAAAWLWAGSEPKKAAAFLGPISLAFGTICVMTIIDKEGALLGGFGGGGAEFDLELGVYVTLAGAVAGLVAAAIAGWPRRLVLDVGSTEPVEMVADRSTDALPDAPA